MGVADGVGVRVGVGVEVGVCVGVSVGSWVKSAATTWSVCASGVKVAGMGSSVTMGTTGISGGTAAGTLVGNGAFSQNCWHPVKKPINRPGIKKYGRCCTLIPQTCWLFFV